jgi:hypothetical protein
MRLGGVTPAGVEVTGFDTERNFIKHCGTDQEGAPLYSFFRTGKVEKIRHARARASAWDNPQKLWITQWTTPPEVAVSPVERGLRSN